MRTAVTQVVKPRRRRTVDSAFEPEREPANGQAVDPEVAPIEPPADPANQPEPEVEPAVESPSEEPGTDLAGQPQPKVEPGDKPPELPPIPTDESADDIPPQLPPIPTDESQDDIPDDSTVDPQSALDFESAVDRDSALDFGSTPDLALAALPPTETDEPGDTAAVNEYPTVRGAPPPVESPPEPPAKSAAQPPSEPVVVPEAKPAEPQSAPAPVEPPPKSKIVSPPEPPVKPAILVTPADDTMSTTKHSPSTAVSPPPQEKELPDPNAESTPPTTATTKTTRKPTKKTTATSSTTPTSTTNPTNAKTHTPPFLSADAAGGVGGRQPSAMTRYTNMLLALDKIPRLDNLLASFFTWLLLAGFVLFPGTFANLQTQVVTGSGGQVEQVAVNAIQHVSLFVIAWVCTGIAAGGMCWLWYKWMNNYVWIVNKIFMCVPSPAPRDIG